MEIWSCLLWCAGGFDPVKGVSGIDSISKPPYDKSEVSNVQNTTRRMLHFFNLVINIRSIVHEHLEAGSIHNRKF